MVAVLVTLLVVAAAVAFAVVAYRRDWRWTGLPADPGDGTPAAPPRPGKTLWDWLQLLIVPLMLALAAFGLNAAQVDRDRKQEERRVAQDRKVEERRAARERASAADRASEETLRTYLQQMSDLMTRPGRATADTQTLAQTHTLVALRRLDGARKGLVVQFLVEAELILDPTELGPAGFSPSPGCGTPGRHACRRAGLMVDLANADLRETVMPSSLGSYEGSTGPGDRFAARGARFDSADLRNADFRGSSLSGVTLTGADLRGADFSGAFLDATSFSGACLTGARFDRVEVDTRANFNYTEGRGVDFSNAELAKATFAGARLSDVQLSGASTSGVRWPRDWTPTGLRMSAVEARELCRGLPR
jgi:uncharacterized protein YjbI with pentapeptide repeats